jgi:hypothetical protein
LDEIGDHGVGAAGGVGGPFVALKQLAIGCADDGGALGAADVKAQEKRYVVQDRSFPDS